MTKEKSMQLMRAGKAAGLAAATALLGLGGIATQAHATPHPSAPSIQHFTCDYTDAEPTLRLGSTGQAVKQAQCQLNSVLDRRVAVDGQFGSGTRSATVAFQQCAGLDDDGVIGPNTWSALDYWWWNDIDCHR
ncbi:peptidoglycan-binding domain-containing protein [Streptomyces sp. NPDC049577]|uniref:peptidoglycan-binding domain-containing protein n=1 Tax=Streptomyces sp. NPDC049577 TaxID=3155153 RepID=UPI00343F6CCE